MSAPSPAPVYLKDYRPPAFLIDRIDLDIALDPRATRVRSKLSVRRNPDPAAPAGPLVLDGDGLTLSSIAVNGAKLADTAYAVTSGGLTLNTTPNEPFELALETLIDPEANTRLMGLYRTNGTYCTQCEAEGFRRITYFPDRPDVLSVYTVRLEADKKDAPILLSNGNPADAGNLEGGRHFAIWHDPHPKPSYLFAAVGGDLAAISDTFGTASGRTVDLNIYVEHGKTDQCAYALDALKRSMAWDEDIYGRQYDLDVFNIVAVSDFNMGAMENKGLNVFNDKYVLARPDTATDQDYANIETVIAHEYFHNWTGNRITCRDWFQLCLKEGLTVFRDQDFSADMRSAAVKRIQDVRTLRAQQFPEDAGPLAHPVRPDKYLEINNFYTPTVYEKGAEIIRMLKMLIGAKAFQAGMALYFDRHDGEAATVDQFIACFAEASGQDLDGFALWYSQSGTPDVKARAQHDAKARTLTLDIKQSNAPTPGQGSKKPMPIPIRLGLVGADGTDLPLETTTPLIDGDTVILTDKTARVTFSNVGHMPAVSLLRGFSAPVRLSQEISATERRHLAMSDSDPFNRWQAVQDLALGELTAATIAVRRGDTPKDGDDGLCDVILACLTDETLDPAFRAHLIALPGEADIARDIRRDIDPEAIHLAREGLRRRIAATLCEPLRRVYEALSPSTDAGFSPDAEQAGMRALRNGVLDYVALAPGGAALAQAHFAKAGTMTDRIAALGLVLAVADDQVAREALESFHAMFCDNALVIDKWFMIQATAPGEQTPDRVRALMDHPEFSITTPNRVRALIGSFAMANQRQFNRADGRGFDLVAGVAADLDSRNPQVAARLLSAFRSWQALEPKRRSLAGQALYSVADRPNLSPDVRDIVDRTLNV